MTTPRRAGEDGFTLIETLAALAATAAIIGALALIAGQWLPSWRHGFAALQRSVVVAEALDRLAADFAAAEFVKGAAAGPQGPMFSGESRSATFVRSALGPNAAPGLEFVRYQEIKDARGLAMTRLSAPFRPGDSQPTFAHPVTLLRAPLRIGFAYSSATDRTWRDIWATGQNLPSAVRITVSDETTGVVYAASTATLLHVTAGAADSAPPASPAPPGGAKP